MSGNPTRVVRAERPIFDDMTPAALENLERQTTSFLYALWGAMGVKKKIIKIESNGYYDGLEMVKDER